jgi:primosomal protein N' (replication factor Y)
MKILRVALDLPLDTLFDYLDGGNSHLKVGQRVLVPFGKRQVIGIILARVALSDVADSKLKSIIQGFEDELPLPAATLQLLKFCADYYQYPLGQALLSALPSRLREGRSAQLPKLTAYQLSAQACSAGLEAIPARARLQRSLYQALADAKLLDAAALAVVSSGWRNGIKQLMQQGWVETVETEQVLPPHMHQAVISPALNPDQQQAVDAMLAEAQAFKVWLLYGITGSGKTEVYMRLLQEVLSRPHTQALVLVPEINLTPQLEARFRARFPNLPMVMLHSQMNESERLHGWLRSQNGQARIIIGTRLSVFTPIKHLALIVVDEEHDASYKQQDGMRYSARDIAIVRAKAAGVPVVLGSATPSLESWHNAQTSRYHLLQLNNRAVLGAALPQINTIDVRQLPPQEALHPQLIAAMRQRLERGEQSLLFINRRGYAPVLLCNACAWVAPCTRCSSRLVVHLRDKRLRCHHCGHEQRMPLQCPSCGNPDLRPAGQGTQRLEELLAEQFPTARILRVDRDSMRRKHAIAAMTRSVHAQEVDILVGTQMLAKGHDFPQLTLVGVIDTDSALFSPDYRAAEKLFAQLMQVSGRAGRAGKAGEVLIQTAFPDHVLFHALQQHDYAKFADSLLQERKLANFPPYCFEALLRAEATHYEPVREFFRAALAASETIHHSLAVYDPVRPRMERLKGMERAQLLIQASARPALQKFLRAWVPLLRALPQANKVRWSMDVDPLDF